MAVKLTILSAFDDRGIRNAQKRLAEFGDATSGYAGSVGANMIKAGAKITRISDAAVATGTTLTKSLTLPLVAGSALAINEAVKYESAFAGVRKTVDATETEFAELRQGIRDMSKELPASREEIAGVVENLGQLGVSTGNLMDVTKVMIDLGESTNLTAEQAAMTLARFSEITGMAETSYSNLGSVVVELGNNFATTETEITDMGLGIAAAGHQVGMNEAQIMGYAAALSSVGMEAQAGGTAISKTMLEIEGAVQRGGAELDLWAKTAGMSADEFTAAWESDPARALESVITGLGDMEAQGTTTITRLDELGISEVRQRDALMRLAGAQGLVTDAIDTSERAWEENQALQEEAEKRYETTASKLEILKNNATDVALELSDALLPAFTDALEAAQPLIDKAAELARGFSNLSPSTQGVIVKLAAAAAAAGPVMTVFGKVGGVVGKTVGAFGNLKLAAEGLEGAPKWATGVVNLGNGIKTLGKNIATTVMNLGKSVVAWAADTAAKAASTIATTAQAVAAKAAAAAQWLLNAALSANPIALVVIAIVALVAAFVLAWKNSDKFREVVTNAWNAVKAAALAVVNWFKTEPPKAFAKVKDAAVSKFTEMIGWVKGVPGKISSALGNLGNLLKAAGLKIIQGLWDGALEKWRKVKEWVSGIAKWIADHKGPLTYDYKLLQPAGAAIMRGFQDALADGFELVKHDLAGYTAEIGGGTGSLAVAAPSSVSGARIVNQYISFPHTPERYSDVVRGQRDLVEGLY